jgi:hypothetical protein
MTISLSAAILGKTDFQATRLLVNARVLSSSRPADIDIARPDATAKAGDTGRYWIADLVAAGSPVFLDFSTISLRLRDRATAAVTSYTMTPDAEVVGRARLSPPADIPAGDYDVEFRIVGDLENPASVTTIPTAGTYRLTISSPL